MNEPGALAFVCPRCRGPLDAAAEQYRCAPCGTTYPIVAGIPDFRVAPDPWIEVEADRAKGLRLEGETMGRSFEAMLRAYWAMTPETPAAVAERFISHVLGAETRSREWLETFPSDAAPRAVGRWLDIGCGTGDLAAAAWPRAAVVGIDVAFRWLVVARRRLAERGVPVQLVCCNAEALPFADASFDRALSLGTIEHAGSSGALLREAHRVLRQGGRLHLRTVNRFSLLRRGQHYLHRAPLGPGRLGRELRAAGFSAVTVEAARMLPSEQARLGGRLAWLIPLYEASRRTQLTRRATRLVAPLLEAEAVAA